jgi:glycosyltransferase involved in cell wall biosynthesis
MDLPAGSVWLDARGTQSVGHAERGIARYVSEHAEALLDLAPELIGWIGLNPDLPLPSAGDAFERSGKLVGQTSSGGPGDGDPPIYHVMSPFEAELELDEIWPPWSRSSRLVVTLYDLIPLIMREQYSADWGFWATAWIARLGLMRSAQQVLTISERTAEDAIEHLQLPEDRVTVIGSGVSDHFSSLVSSRHEGEALVRSQLPKVRPGFLLYVGGVDYRKNLDGALRGYAELPAEMRNRHQFVIVCKLPYHRRLSLRTFALDLGIESRNLLLTGFVPDRTLAALYRSCELFIFPSLYEGAGLPILEAMTCGAPVAASGISAMPELLGDPSATFDPADPADISRCIRELLEDPARLDALRESSRKVARAHTWKRVAERTVEGYERALSAPLPAGVEVGTR